jgi:pyruvate dehydrogenase E2 component (dihydrolipoamide acetyltransferase)
MYVCTAVLWRISANFCFETNNEPYRTIDFEAQDDGIIAKILKEGKDAVDLKVGVPICVVVDDEDYVSSFADFTVEDKPAVSPDSSSSSLEKISEEPAESSSNVSLEHILMPSARHLSQSKGFDATGLKGSGKGGRVTKGDVLKALKDGIHLPPLSASNMISVEEDSASSSSTSSAVPSSAPASPVAAAAAAKPTMDVVVPIISTSGTFTDVRNNNMRKVIAKRLTESKSTVPHFYATAEIELDNIMALRNKLKAMEVKVSVNDLIIRASALALRDVPEVNASYAKGMVRMSPTVDISVAVATPGGLITPILHNTDQLGLSDISSKVKDLATRARDGKLAPEEYQGGTFCISNLGMFGINEFSAVINPPQAAILAVGGGVKKVIVNTVYDENEKVQEEPCVKNIMSARLSADRRVVDEATAGLFLSALRCYLAKPELLVL